MLINIVRLYLFVPSCFEGQSLRAVEEFWSHTKKDSNNAKK
jgi:hypothetical protein